MEAIHLLARTEGIFTETAGGVTLAAAKKLYAQGRIHPEETTVLAVTGNGLKTLDAIAPAYLETTRTVAPRLADFEAFVEEAFGTELRQEVLA